MQPWSVPLPASAQSQWSSAAGPGQPSPRPAGLVLLHAWSCWSGTAGLLPRRAPGLPVGAPPPLLLVAHAHAPQPWPPQPAPRLPVPPLPAPPLSAAPLLWLILPLPALTGTAASCCFRWRLRSRHRRCGWRCEAGPRIPRPPRRVPAPRLWPCLPEAWSRGRPWPAGGNANGNGNGGGGGNRGHLGVRDPGHCPQASGTRSCRARASERQRGSRGEGPGQGMPCP